MRSETRKRVYVYENKTESKQTTEIIFAINQLPRSAMKVTRINTLNKEADKQKKKKYIYIKIQPLTGVAMTVIEFAELYLKITSMMKEFRPKPQPPPYPPLYIPALSLFSATHKPILGCPFGEVGIR